MPTIVLELVRTGKLKIEARPIAFIGPDSLPARYEAIAAGSQNRMFNFMQVMVSSKDTFDAARLAAAIRRLGGSG
jgi:hypothetical protein